jgi:anti-sigma B factor antagonist
MKTEVTKEEKYVLLKFGEKRLDAIQSPDVKAQLLALKSEGFKNIILDLSEVEYTDSSGLSCILTANRISKEQNGILVLAGLQTQVQKLIEITQLHRVIESFKRVEEAIDRVFLFEIENDLGKENN